ncbi:hypothetical protein [Actinoplanes sp. NPDC023714]|uniref:hypothetical protein n=1 Tax=Actinoplanes sp. NPDC023714 TaxID=3154322 RepID=UPI0033F2C332
MRNLEDNLRDVVLGLADDAPPPHDLAAIARSRGRGIRRRRHAAVAVAAVALIGVTVTPYAVLREDTAPPPVTAVSPTPSTAPSARALPPFDARKPYELPGGAVVVALSSTEEIETATGEVTAGSTHHVLLDRGADRYAELPGDYLDVTPGPRSLVAVHDGPDAEREVVLVTADGEVRRRIPYQPVGDRPQWSPDGDRLLIPTLEGFAVTGVRASDEIVTGPLSNCPDYCSLSWLPGGTEFAVPQRDTSVPHDEALPDPVGRLEVRSAATGEVLRELPLAGRPLGTRGWSPDGSRVLLRDRTGTIVLTEVADGTKVAGLPGSDALFLPDGRILVLDGEYVLLCDARGTQLEKGYLPAEFRGLAVQVGAP